MNRINRRFTDRFGGHWIKIKFYRENPNLKGCKRLEDVRFCEATKEAIMHPVFLDKDSISCEGAKYAFGWSSNGNNLLCNTCQDKNQAQMTILQSMSSKTPYFKRPFKYIGLNTEGEPDLIMAYMQPEEIMDIIKIYNYKYGKNLDVSLCSIMSICSGIAVRTYLDNNITFSFGCNDSRNFAKIGRNNLAVGIPNKLLKTLVG